MESHEVLQEGLQKTSNHKLLKIVACFKVWGFPSVLIIALCTEVNYKKRCHFVHTSLEGQIKPFLHDDHVVKLVSPAWDLQRIAKLPSLPFPAL